VDVVAVPLPIDWRLIGGKIFLGVHSMVLGEMKAQKFS
jgi:hypothetical protein